MENYDLIIIGSGPAGLTAAVYAARYRINFLVIGKMPGGLMGEAYEICNFPSYKRVKGVELMRKMINQVTDLKVDIKSEEVLDIKKMKTGFEIKTSKNQYNTKKVIIATGSERKKLGIAREKELIGKGISYCATCDAGFYKDKIVGVAGGSDAALTTALLLSKYAKKVYIVYRQDKFFRGDNVWIEEVKKNKKIESLFNSEITKLIGKDKLEEIEVNGKIKLKIDGVFVEVGSIPNLELTKKIGIKIEKNQIVTDKQQKTNVKDIFAAGDVTDNPLKQIVTACGEGATAANSVYKELIKER